MKETLEIQFKLRAAKEAYVCTYVCTRRGARFSFLAPPRHCRVYNMKIYLPTLLSPVAKRDESIERAFDTSELLSNVEGGAEGGRKRRGCAQGGRDYGKCDNSFETGILPRCTQLYRYTVGTIVE